MANLTETDQKQIQIQTDWKRMYWRTTINNCIKSVHSEPGKSFQNKSSYLFGNRNMIINTTLGKHCTERCFTTNSLLALSLKVGR